MSLSPAEIAGLCGFIFLAGFIDSIAGGGGLISVPAYFAFGLPAHAALATNKFSSVVGTLVATIRYWMARKVDVRVGLWAAAGALGGSALGARIALWIPAAAIETLVLVLVPAVLVVLLLRDRLIRPVGDGGGVRAVAGPALLIGAVVGTYDGFFGPGTGTFLTIAFHLVFRFDLLGAAGNARLANLASNAGALAVFLADGRVLFPLAIWTGLAGMAGNQLGSMLALRRGEQIVRAFLALVLVLLLAETVRRRFVAG